MSFSDRAPLVPVRILIENAAQMPHRTRPATVVSRNMASIRSRGTALEIAFGKVLWRAGLRYRKHYAVIGKPDFALPRLKIAIFCDSHYWHGYRWKESGRRQIKTRRNFWVPKIERNIQRDREVNRALRGQGWAVLRFWEHELKDSPDKCLLRVMRVCRRRQRKTEEWQSSQLTVSRARVEPPEGFWTLVSASQRASTTTPHAARRMRRTTRHPPFCVLT